MKKKNKKIMGEKEHMQAKDSESSNKERTRETQMRNVTNDKKERFLITLTERERKGSALLGLLFAD